jgi:hypothetical protein
MLVEFLSGYTVPGRSYAVGEVGYLTGDRLTVALHQGVAKVVGEHWPWEDLTFPVTGINPPGGDADPTLDPADGLYSFSATATNTLAMVIQTQHAMIEGGSLRFHCHWKKTTSAAGNVLWRLAYQLPDKVTRVYPGTFTELDASTVAAGTPDDDTAEQELITQFAAIDLSGHRISTNIHIMFSRIGGDSADTYAAAAKLLAVDAHVQRDGLGSNEEYSR